MSRLLIGRSARRARVERPMTIPFARLEPRQQDPNPSGKRCRCERFIRNRTVACATSPPACRASEARVPLCVQHAVPPPRPEWDEGSDLRTTGEKSGKLEPVTRPVLPPFNARPVSNIFSTSTVRSSPAHHRHRSHSRVSRADKGTEGGRRLRPSQHRCSLLSLSSLDVNAPCCTRSRSRRHLARLGLARGGGSGVVAVAAAHPTVHLAPRGDRGGG